MGQSTRKPCSIDGCDAPSAGRGWCMKHWMRWRKHGDPLTIIRRPAKVLVSCAVDGCERMGQTRGWCSVHYHRWQRHGDPLTILRYPRIVRRTGDSVFCSVEGCTKSVHARGCCTMHYARWLRDGEPGEASRRSTGKPPRIGGVINDSGYRQLQVNGRVVLEHRLVMETHLGRTLLRTETVHHRNGQRAQNDIANLELWSTSQPKGQRVIDKLRWAREIVALYGEAEQVHLI